MATIVAFAAIALGTFFAPFKKSEVRDSTHRPAKLPRVSSSVDGISKDDVLQQEVVSRVTTGFKPFRPTTPDQKAAAPTVISESFVPRGKLLLSFEPEAPVELPPASKNRESVLAPGIIIPCRLFNGIESNLPETPLVAHVLVDIRINGKVALPRGSQVHGAVRADDQRRRVMTGSTWQIVTPGGKTINVTGMGLTRDYDGHRDVYGQNDGFAGIGGIEVRPDQQASKRFFAATGLAAISRLGQQRNPTLFGDQVVASVGNSVLEGGASVASQYAQMKLREVEKNRPFIRVAAGTEFYLYTQKPVTIKQAEAEPQLSDALRERERLMDDLRSRLQSQPRAINTER